MSNGLDKFNKCCNDRELFKIAKRRVIVTGVLGRGVRRDCGKQKDFQLSV